MGVYLTRRLLQLIPTFLCVTFVVFVLLQLAPGDPLALQVDELGRGYSADSIEAWRELKGLDEPLWRQYATWLVRFVRLDFGVSLVDERPVRALLAEALPPTLLLTGLALLLTYLLAVPLGVHSALRYGAPLERTMSAALFALYSIPSFWMALVLILVFGGGGLLEWFPIRGLQSDALASASFFGRALDLVWHLVLPVACLTYPALARTSRYQRNALLEVTGEDFVRTARAKGLSPRMVVLRHALRNALLPMLTLVALDLPWLISGSVIIERIFTIRGMGMLTFEAVLRRDYPVLMGAIALGAILTMAALLLADLAYAWIDPRIRYRSSS